MKTNHCAHWLAAAVMLMAAACSTKPAEVAESTPQSAEVVTSAKTLTGVLTHNPAPKTKSVEAYVHVEFTLEDEEGKTHNLSASSKVSHDDLMARVGARVEIVGAWVGPRSPDPTESAPIGIDGESMKRPGRYEVLSLVAK